MWESLQNCRVQVELPTTYGGRPGGFAFVEYATESDAASAIEKLQGLSELEVTFMC
jgi:hypothetical protein